VLVTGASGVVGAAVIDQLRDHEVVSLTHRRPVPGAVVQLHGDLGAPDLGLDRRRYEWLASHVGAIVHCAAVTDFGADARATHELNVRGTEQVLALAERSGAVLHHVSTAFVSRRELTRERGQDTTSARPDHYLDSKRAAEQAVRDSGLPATIIRPSVVIGHSLTGRIARFQGLHAIAGAVLRGTLPMVPLDRQARVDFVPQDLVARTIAALVRTRTTSGEFWVTAGAAAVTAARMVELAVETGRRLGLPVDAPRLVDPEMVDRLIRPVFIDPLPEPDRARFDGLLAMAALFGTDQPFATSLDAVPGLRAPTTAELEGAFAASLRHYAEVKGLLGQVAA
jgi:thioester reductase-like protein